MSSSVTITMHAEDTQRRFRALAGVMEDTTPVMAAIGVTLVSNTHDRFMRGVAPDGSGWAALNPDYALAKRGPGILRESAMSGGLMGSITHEAGRDQVEVGTNKIYAGVHQNGATITPKNGAFLIFRLGGGNAKTVFARSVTIPARPFLGISAEDERAIGETLEDALTAALE